MQQELTPDLFWQTMTGYQQTAALKAAVDVGIFTAVDNGSKTAAAIADATGSAERGVRIISDAMTVLGFLTKSGDEYSLTPSTAAFLSKNSRMYIGSVMEFITSPWIRSGFDSLTEAVRQGGTAVKVDGSLDPESPMWVTFARAMGPMMFPSAQAITEVLAGDADRPLKVLDIAAGHGIFGVTVAQRFPNAEIYALDWKNVLEVAKENAEKFGVADRYHTIPGSAFEAEFGEGYDVVLLTNLLHHFDRETCTSLLRRVNSAMKDDGRLITLEFVPNDDRVTPPQEALFAVTMLAGTPAGDAYTYNELRGMLEDAGFSTSEHIPLQPLPQHMIVSRK